MTALPPGKYTLSVEAQGFKKFLLTDVTLAVQQQATLDVPLQVGDIATSVQVEGTTPLLNTTIATLGQVIDNRYMMSLPNLGTQSAGADQPDSGRGGRRRRDQRRNDTNFVANGARNSTSDVLVDGAIVNTTEQNTGRDGSEVDAFRGRCSGIQDADELLRRGVCAVGRSDHQHGDQIRHQRVPRRRLLLPARLDLNANSWSANRAGSNKYRITAATSWAA